MIDLVSLAFPLLLVSFVLWRFPVQPDRYVSDCAEIPVRATVGSQGKSEISTQTKIVYWVISIGCGTLIGIGQLLLFRLDVSQSSDYIFESRMLDSVAYPFLPGMVVGLFCGMVLCFHLIKGYGTHYLIGSLRKTWNGISLGAWYSKANIMGLSFGLLALAFNLLAYHTYLLVTQHDIKYRRWRSSVVHQPISALQEIRTHNTNGWGSATGKRQVDLVFKNGTVVRTTFIVAAQRREEFIESIKRVSKGKVPMVEATKHSM